MSHLSISIPPSTMIDQELGEPSRLVNMMLHTRNPVQLLAYVQPGKRRSVICEHEGRRCCPGWRKLLIDPWGSQHGVKLQWAYESTWQCRNSECSFTAPAG